MTDEAQTAISPKPTLPKAVEGFTAPITVPADGKLPEHIHPDTLMAKGIDPDTKERLAVSLVVLQHEHGDEKGKELYGKVARAGGFGDPNSEPSGSVFFPDLVLEGIDPKVRAKVDAILKG